MSRAHRRGPWVAEEDATLLSLVASRGPNNWVQISQHMHFRSPKQCRERYHQNLKATLNHDPISAEEGELIEQMVNEMGKKWAEIARRLGNRSDNAVKNWWNGSQNRRKRHVLHHGPSSKTLSNRTQPISAVRSPKSTTQQTQRRRYYDETPTRYDQSWQDIDSLHGGQRILRSQQSFVPDQPYPHAQTSSSARHLERSQDNSFQQPPPEYSRPAHPRVGSDNHVAPLLPALGPINTSHSSPSFPSHTLQPPYSATSMDRAPSLVSDHNSTYSISPKTWPSPRPEMPAPLDTSRSRWHGSSQFDRRGSAPVIPSLISMSFAGDEGYVSAIPPSASSDSKYLLPTPMDRPSTYDERYNNIHRHSASNPNISLPPLVPRSDPPSKESTSPRDTRMNFSSLLN
jgi:Myb-like DNA-binding protein FlbD